MTSFQMRPIGRVESALRELKEAPKQADEGAPPAWLIFEPEMRPALLGLRSGDRVILITWLDHADRDVLSIHPRGDTSRSPQGVFSTRSPHRPNPIGLHPVEITAVEDLRVRVRALEALDGTPVIDLKPTLESDVGKR